MCECMCVGAGVCMYVTVGDVCVCVSVHVCGVCGVSFPLESNTPRADGQPEPGPRGPWTFL